MCGLHSVSDIAICVESCMSTCDMYAVCSSMCVMCPV